MTVEILIAIVILFQIITMIMVAKNTNALKTILSRKPQRDNKRGNRDNQRKKRERKFDSPKSPKNNGAASGIDSSLRDINLKLKNVERSQEKTRKKYKGMAEEENDKGQNNRNRGKRSNRRRPNNRYKNRDSQDSNTPENQQNTTKESVSSSNDKVVVKRRVLETEKGDSNTPPEKEPAEIQPVKDSGKSEMSPVENKPAPESKSENKPEPQPEKSNTDAPAASPASDTENSKTEISFGRR